MKLKDIRTTNWLLLEAFQVATGSTFANSPPSIKRKFLQLLDSPVPEQANCARCSPEDDITLDTSDFCCECVNIQSASQELRDISDYIKAAMSDSQ